MSASRNSRCTTSPAGLPAPEGVAPPSISGAGLFVSNHVDQMGPQLADVPAPREVSSAFGAGVFTDHGDLVDLPEFRRVTERRFRSECRPTTHYRESPKGRPGVPLGARPQPPP